MGSDMTAEIPIGQRFSHVYIDRVGESERMRVRMRSLVDSIGPLRNSTVAEDELGVEFNSWREFFRKAEMRDVLCLVTVAYRRLGRTQHVGFRLAGSGLKACDGFLKKKMSTTESTRKVAFIFILTKSSRGPARLR
jgi:hypothetical protein